MLCIHTQTGEGGRSQEKRNEISNSEFTGKTSLYLVVFEMQSNPKSSITVSDQ